MQLYSALTKIFILSVGLIALTFAAVAEAGPHPATKGNKVTGVPTYLNSGEIGNMIFTDRPTKPNQKDYSAGVLERLEFKRGSLPEFYGRRFYFCTLKEAVDYIKKRESTASGFKLQTSMKVQDKRGSLPISESTFMEVSSEMLVPGTWNTTHFEGKERIGKELSALAAGEYVLYVDTYLTYEYIPNKLTGKKEPSNILLAAGKLPLSVK